MRADRVIFGRRSLASLPRISQAFAIAAILPGVWITATSGRASLVTFPVSSPQGTISQASDGSTVNTLTLGSINIGNGTFVLGSPTAPSFGVGLNPTAAPQASWFFAQQNNNVAWLISSVVVPVLTAGTTVDSGGTYTVSDPNFAAAWQSGVSSGYAGLRLASGSDFYYGYATISYVAGSPNQVTVSSFAFENQVNTPVVVPEPSMPLSVGAGGVALTASLLRRRQARRGI